MAGSISASVPKTAKRNSTITITGSVKPSYANVILIVERKIGNGSWKKIRAVKTGSNGKWSLVRKVGSSKLTVSYRVKTQDALIGTLVSKAKTVKIK
jgi:hypothetical protein